MSLSDIWRGQTGRLSYAAALLISSAAIAVVPFVAGKIIMALAEGRDPAMAIVRMLISPLIYGIGLLITGGPLVFFARRRMRELGLSGVWLQIFPLGPLQLLLGFAIASTTMVIWPLPIMSPVTALPFWVECAFGVLLAVLPAGDHLQRSRNGIVQFALRITACDGRLGRKTFAIHLAIAAGLTIVLTAAGLGYLGLIMRPGQQSVSIVASVVGLATTLLSIFTMMFVTASTIRRLHDLNLRGWWIVLFPYGFMSVGAILVLIPMLTPQLFAAMLSQPYIIFSGLQGLGCLILLGCLLFKRGSDRDNPYGPPVDTGTPPIGISRD